MAKSATIKVDRWDPVGGLITGTYHGAFEPPGDAGTPRQIGGAFRVCHVPDDPPAP